jgi:hypothetical protein
MLPIPKDLDFVMPEITEKEYSNEKPMELMERLLATVAWDDVLDDIQDDEDLTSHSKEIGNIE